MRIFYDFLSFMNDFFLKNYNFHAHARVYACMSKNLTIFVYHKIIFYNIGNSKLDKDVFIIVFQKNNIASLYYILIYYLKMEPQVCGNFS